MPMSSKQFLYCVRQEIYKESDLIEHIEKSIMEHQQGHLNIRPVISAKLSVKYTHLRENQTLMTGERSPVI